MSKHHRCALDTDGATRLSRQVANDDTPLLDLLDVVVEFADGESVT